MRKFLSAGVLSAAAAVALMPLFSAQATAEEGNGSEAEWTYVEDYFHLPQCRDAGEAGVDTGEWDHYKCEFQTVPGEWNLYVIDHDDEDDEEGDDD